MSNTSRRALAGFAALALGWGCGDDGSDGSDETGHTQETETGHSHDTGSSAETGATSDASTGSGGSSGGQGVTPDAYCDCLLVNCHDPYHDMWGESDVDAAMACREDAAGYPQNGEPTMEGDFIECRMAHCELAADDPTSCDAALGAAPCQ